MELNLLRGRLLLPGSAFRLGIMGASRWRGIHSQLLAAPHGPPGLPECADVQCSTLIHHAVCTLSEMELGASLSTSRDPGAGEGCKIGGSQAALAEISAAVASMGPRPTDMSPEQAAKDIHVTTDYRGESCTTVPLDVDKLSLPEEGAEPVPLEFLLGGTGRDEVKSFFESHVKPYAEGCRDLADIGVVAYHDPRLRSSGRAYRRFIFRLYRAGMLDFVATDNASDALVEVGCFAVRKKDDKQRLVLDCRTSNCFSRRHRVRSCRRRRGTSFAPRSVSEHAQLRRR